MWFASRTWILKKVETMQEEGIVRLAALGDILRMPCQFVLEGQERKHERSYLGFGEGWILSGLGKNGADPLTELRKFVQNWTEACVPLYDSGEAYSQPMPASGLVGYFDYEWGLAWHKPAATVATPQYFFRVCPVNLVWLPKTSCLILEIFATANKEAEKLYLEWQRAVGQVLLNLGVLEGLQEQVRHRGSGASAVRQVPEIQVTEPAPEVLGSSQVPANFDSGKTKDVLAAWRGNLSRTAYIRKVKCIQEYIKAGDVFQVVLSQRLTTKAKCSDWEIYKYLRKLNPSPYLFYVKGNEETLVGSSPELLLSAEGSRVTTRPIAGTRPRGREQVSDQVYEAELRADIKENAEHAMLVDLGRNDLGRVAKYGSVKVTQYAEVERFSHVMHLVSTVEGELEESQDGLSGLRAVFPAGTLTGAPKVRAMEIIQELEPERRGAYGGALGIVRWNGDVDFCITIRTLRFTETEISVQVGAGIVYDSVPEREYEETLHKARALIEVVNEVANGYR